ncbi:hypothetical protein [Desulfatiferula olefinivorans]
MIDEAVFICDKTLHVRIAGLVFFPQALDGPSVLFGQFHRVFPGLDFLSGFSSTLDPFGADTGCLCRGHVIDVLAANFFFNHLAVFFENDVINLLLALAADSINGSEKHARIVCFFPF